MSDTFITVIAIILSAVLVIVVPLVATSERVDSVSQLDVETLTSNFVDEIRTTGKLTLDDYDKFLERLTSTGNTYDVSMEFKILDENPGKKSMQTTKDKIGENVYYSLYTTQIEDVLNNEETHTYNLKQGDIVSITVRNTNLTLGQQLKDFTYKIVGNDTYTISASNSGLVIGNGSTEVILANSVNENTIGYTLREKDSEGKLLYDDDWTNKDVYVELYPKNSTYNLDLIYYYRNYEEQKGDYRDYRNGYNAVTGSSLTFESSQKIQVYWKHSALEKYSDIRTININIDKELPSISSVTIDNNEIAVNCSDIGGSGIEYYYCYWTDNKNNIPYDEPSTNLNNWVYIGDVQNFEIKSKDENDGQFCTVWVKDKAGNISNGITTDKVIDNKAPTINWAGYTGLKTLGVKAHIGISAIDKGSGIVAYQFSKDANLTANSSGWITNGTPTIEKFDRATYVYTIGPWYAYVKDAAGNVSRSEAFTVPEDATDKILPKIIWAGHPGGTTTDGKTLIAVVAQDRESGIVAYQFSKDANLTANSSGWIAIDGEPKTNEYSASTGVSVLGPWYAYVKDDAGNVSRSDPFDVKDTYQFRITIEPSTSSFTNGNVAATITYGSLTENRKAGFGTTLASAQEAANTSTATTLTATTNGYFYAEATDELGNKVTASYHVENIDKTSPTILYSGHPGGTTTDGKTLIAVVAQDRESGIVAYQFSKDANLTANSSGWIAIDGEPKANYVGTTGISVSGTWYAYVKDAAGNITRDNTGTTINFEKITINLSPDSYTNENVTATITYGGTLTLNRKAGFGTTLESAKAAASASTATSLIATTNGCFYVEATDASGNKVTASYELTIIDKISPTIGYFGYTGDNKNGKRQVVVVAQDRESGLVAYQFSQNANLTASSSGWKTDFENTDYGKQAKDYISVSGTWYAYVKDAAGNITKREL